MWWDEGRSPRGTPVNSPGQGGEVGWVSKKRKRPEHLDRKQAPGEHFQ